MKTTYILSLFFTCFFSAIHSQQFISLEQCRSLGLEHNRQLKSDQLKLKSAQSNTQAAIKDKVFSVDGSSSFIYNAQKVTDEGATVNNRYLYRAGLNAHQVIYGGGRIKYNIDLNQIKETQAMEYINLSELDVVYQIDNIYWNAVTFNEYVSNWERYLVYLDEFLKVVNERVESGLVGQNDLLTAKVKYNEVEIALANAEGNYKRTISKLCSAMGKPVNAKLSVSDSLIYNGMLPDTSNVFISALNNRPELRISEIENESINIHRNLIKAKYRLGINAGINVNYGNQINNNTDAANVIGLASMGIPISHWGKKKNELSSNTYQALITEENIENVKESISLEIQLAIVSLEEAIKQIGIAESAKENARANLKIANNKYNEGLSSIVEVTDAQSILQNALINYIQSKSNYFYSLTAYNRAVANY